MNKEEIEKRIDEIFEEMDKMDLLDESILSEFESNKNRKQHIDLSEELLELIKLEFPEVEWND